MPNPSKYKLVKLSEGTWGISLVLREYSYPDPNQALNEIGRLERKAGFLAGEGHGLRDS